VKIIRNERAEPITARHTPPGDSRARVTSIVIRLAILIAVALVVLGFAFNR
jgi:hypothetical protein